MAVDSQDRGGAAFDEYARCYDEALNEGLAVSGESRSYFAQGRVNFWAGCLTRLGVTKPKVVDFGCGTGETSPLLMEELGASYVVGVEVSPESLVVARKQYGSEHLTFLSAREFQANGEMDVAYCNGVFHHVPVSQRHNLLGELHKSIRPGGYFALWENNPWNPGTRYVMRRISFDRDAVTLSPLETRRLVGEAGFKVVRTDFLFIFPRIFRWLRCIEPMLSRFPFGAQYQVLCQRVVD